MPRERSLLNQVVPLLEPSDLLDTPTATFDIARAFLYLGIKHVAKPALSFENMGEWPGNRWENPAIWAAAKPAGCTRNRSSCPIRRPRPHHAGAANYDPLGLRERGGGEQREIHLHTNLPANVTAKKIAGLYRKRWTLEQAFNELTTHLRCELNTLGYPKAALFSRFAWRCAMLQRPGRPQRRAAGACARRATVEKEGVSNFYLTNEIHSVYGGMMVMLPPRGMDTVPDP